MTIEPKDQSSPGLQELYRAPAVDTEVPPGPTAQGAFYVVSTQKFLTLYVATLGAYQLFWFFANWRRHRDRTGEALYPFWRSVFAVFFAHKLFHLIGRHEPRAGRPRAPRVSTSELNWMATLFVVLTVAARVLDRVSTPLLDLISLALTLATAYPLLVAQRAANDASGDPEGASNSSFSALNLVFIGLGALLWVLIVLGIGVGEE